MPARDLTWPPTHLTYPPHQPHLPHLPHLTHQPHLTFPEDEGVSVFFVFRKIFVPDPWHDA